MRERNVFTKLIIAVILSIQIGCEEVDDIPLDTPLAITYYADSFAGTYSGIKIHYTSGMIGNTSDTTNSSYSATTINDSTIAVLFTNMLVDSTGAFYEHSGLDYLLIHLFNDSLNIHVNHASPGGSDGYYFYGTKQ